MNMKKKKNRVVFREIESEAERVLSIFLKRLVGKTAMEISNILCGGFNVSAGRILKIDKYRQDTERWQPKPESIVRAFTRGGTVVHFTDGTWMTSMAETD